MRAILANDEDISILTLNERPERNYKKIKIDNDNLAPRQTEALLNKFRFSFGTRLCLPTQKGFTIVKLEEIIYCQAQRNYTQLHLLNNKSVTVSKPLTDYDQILTDSNFLRVHKSFLINMQHIKEYTRGEGGSVILSNGMEIEVSRRRKESFMIKVKEYFKY